MAPNPHAITSRNERLKTSVLRRAIVLYRLHQLTFDARAADSQSVTDTQLDALAHPLVVDECAVGAVVLEPHAAAILPAQAAVQARDAGPGVYSQPAPIGRHPATEREWPPAQRIGAAAMDEVRRVQLRWYRRASLARGLRGSEGRDRQMLNERKLPRVAPDLALVRERPECCGTGRQHRDLDVAQFPKPLGETRQRSAPVREPQMQHAAGGTCALNGPQVLVIVPRGSSREFSGGNLYRHRTFRRWQLYGHGRTLGSCGQPARQAVGQPLLAACFVQRVEPRPPHECRGNHVEPALLERKPPVLRQDLVAQPAQLAAVLEH